MWSIEAYLRSTLTNLSGLHLHDGASKGNNEALRALVELKADLTNRDSLEKKTCLHKVRMHSVTVTASHVSTMSQLQPLAGRLIDVDCRKCLSYERKEISLLLPLIC